jgi:hypothetical protein
LVIQQLALVLYPAGADVVARVFASLIVNTKPPVPSAATPVAVTL